MQRIESDRDRALRRLRRASTVAGVLAGALVGVFSGLAAKAFPGHHAVRVPKQHGTVAQRVTPPPLVPVESEAGPSPPAAPPTPTSAAPVVSSGGS